MEFLDIAKKRYSVRNYTEQKVEAEKLEQILEAAHVAPTAANLQPVHLIVAQSEEALQKVGKAANIYNAPVAVIVCADHDKAWVRPFDHKNTCDIDASILTDHMMLQATELGLPDNLEPVNILVIGYANENAPGEDRHEKTRIPVKQLVSYDKL